MLGFLIFMKFTEFSKIYRNNFECFYHIKEVDGYRKAEVEMLFVRVKMSQSTCLMTVPSAISMKSSSIMEIGCVGAPNIRKPPKTAGNTAFKHAKYIKSFPNRKRKKLYGAARI